MGHTADVASLVGLATAVVALVAALVGLITVLAERRKK
jgi:hypothetical protein